MSLPSPGTVIVVNRMSLDPNPEVLYVTVEQCIGISKLHGYIVKTVEGNWWLCKNLDMYFTRAVCVLDPRYITEFEEQYAIQRGFKSGSDEGPDFYISQG